MKKYIYPIFLAFLLVFICFSVYTIIPNLNTLFTLIFIMILGATGHFLMEFLKKHANQYDESAKKIKTTFFSTFIILAGACLFFI
ncbi:ABC transporter permease protein [Bacillus sp. TS-2]|nr:ABC transporter permease protein [Bacillus sp. TS-2]